MKKQHGGRRKGAGMKPADGATGLKPYRVSLDDPTVKKAKTLGNGSLSLGIRKKFKEEK